MTELNKLQAAVLEELYHHPSRRFSDMMAVTGLTSDDFKFHLRKLVKLGLVSKQDDGEYELTAQGKEFANRFDYAERTPIYQPKLTTATFVWRHNLETGETEYLFHQRRRQPFFDYWGVVGQPVAWGEQFEVAAARGLSEQAGLLAPLSLRGFHRQQDTDQASKTVLEDKLFVVFSAEWQGEEPKIWEHAEARWMTAAVLAKQAKRFDSCVAMLAKLDAHQLWFDESSTAYVPSEY